MAAGLSRRACDPCCEEDPPRDTCCVEDIFQCMCECKATGTADQRPSARPEAPCCCSLGRHLRQALLAHEARLLRELRQLLRPPEDLPPAPSPQPPAPSGAARGCPGGKGGGLALGVPEPPREAPVLTLAVPPGFRSEVEKVTRFRRRVSEVCIEGRAPAHDGHDLELERLSVPSRNSRRVSVAHTVSTIASSAAFLQPSVGSGTVAGPLRRRSQAQVPAASQRSVSPAPPGGGLLLSPPSASTAVYARRTSTSSQAPSQLLPSATASSPRAGGPPAAAGRRASAALTALLPQGHRRATLLGARAPGLGAAGSGALAKVRQTVAARLVDGVSLDPAIVPSEELGVGTQVPEGEEASSPRSSCSSSRSGSECDGSERRGSIAGSIITPVPEDAAEPKVIHYSNGLSSQGRGLSPDVSALWVWDVILAVCCILNAFIVPLMLAFEPMLELLVLFWLTTVVFTADMALSTVRGFYMDGEPVTSLQAILARYLTSGRLAADLTATWVAALPLPLPGWRLLRLICLSHVPRCLRVVEDQFPRSQFHLIVSLVQTVGAFLLITHWSACVWGALGNGSLWQGPLVWTFPGVEEGVPWIENRGLEHAGVAQQYLMALVFAAGIMTGSDSLQQPSHAGEMLCYVVIALASFFICSTILSRIVVTTSRLSEDWIQFRDHLRGVSAFMVNRQVPRALQQKVQRYLEFQFRHRKTHGGGQAAFMQELSPWLQQEITRHLVGELICFHPFFANMPPQALNHLCLDTVTTLCSAGDIVIEMGQTMRMMFFVVSGKLGALSVDSGPVSRRSRSEPRDNRLSYSSSMDLSDYTGTLMQRTSSRARSRGGQGDTLVTTTTVVGGEEHQGTIKETWEPGWWLDDVSLFKDAVRMMTVVSLTDSELLVVTREAMLKLVEVFPEVARYFEDVKAAVIADGLQDAGLCCMSCGHPGHSALMCPV